MDRSKLIAHYSQDQLMLKAAVLGGVLYGGPCAGDGAGSDHAL